MNILNLPDWGILAVEEHEHDYRISATYDAEVRACAHCASIGQLQGFGTKTQLYLDLPVHGKRVGVLAQRRRFRCKACGKTFLQPLPDTDERHGTTKRLVAWIKAEALRRTFVSLADDTGLHERTIRRIFHEHVDDLARQQVFQTPECLGIDEMHLVRQHRCVLTNVAERSIIELLPNRNKSTVVARLLRLPERTRVRLVCMDMWAPYRDAVRSALPRAEIVVDKFHVVRMANEAVDQVRKSVREDLSPSQRKALMHDRFLLLRRRSELDERDAMILETWLARFPLLGAAYDLKERYYTIWDLEDRVEALMSYGEWRQTIPPALLPAFKPLLTALKNWEVEIFAYFDHRVTNAYTEALNGLAKLANRLGRGYSFEVLRAKLLYTEGLHNVRQPGYARRSEEWDAVSLDLGLGNVLPREVLQRRVRSGTVLSPVNLGVDISTLTRAIMEHRF